MATEFIFDWSELAFASKKVLRELDAIFIMAPRELSKKRIASLVKEYLPKGNLVIGVAQEEYIIGFENQPQYKTLQISDVQSVLDLVNSKPTSRKIYILSYAQRELSFILEKKLFKHVVGIRGSWLHSFHTGKAYHVLAEQKLSYELISPFVDEEEAKKYDADMQSRLQLPLPSALLMDDEAVLRLAADVAKQSYDTSFQTGVVLARKTPQGYLALLAAHNKVVPYETYAWHFGAAREVNFSPAHDLNHYDTIHAEMNLLVQAQRDGVDLKNTTLFINLMPCPTCARTLSQTDIETFIYSVDHSSGYAVKLFEQCGKNVKRVVY